MALPSTEDSAPPADAAVPQEEASTATSAETGSAGVASSASAPVTDSTAPATGTQPMQTESLPPPGVAGEESKTPTPMYHAVTTGQPVDPAAVQAAAIAQQHAMYSGFGSPYAAPGAMYQQNMAGGYPVYYGGGPAAPAPLYTMKAPTLPGPCYYDPYGMLNPVACIAPMRMASQDEHASTKLFAAKKQNRWCC